MSFIVLTILHTLSLSLPTYLSSTLPSPLIKQKHTQSFLPENCLNLLQVLVRTLLPLSHSVPHTFFKKNSTTKIIKVEGKERK